MELVDGPITIGDKGNQMRATVFAVGFVAGLALSGTGLAQSKPARAVIRGEDDALRAFAGKRARYAVIVGDMRDASSFEGGDLGPQLATRIARKLREMDGIAVMRTSEVTDEVRRLISRMRIPTVRLEGRVTSVERGVLDGQASLRCQVALVLLDDSGGALRSVLLGAATGVESSSRKRTAHDKPLAVRALDGALDSALGGMLQVLAGTAREASVAPPADKRLALRR